MKSHDGLPRRRPRSLWALATLALLILASSPSLAEKVVLFKNGKSIRAKSVKEDKGWSRLELEGGLVGVRTGEIAQVQEVGSNSVARADALPNQASGGGGGGGGGYAAPSYGGGEAPAEAPPPPEEYQPPQAPEEARGGGYRGNPGLPSNIPGLRQAGGLSGQSNARGGVRSLGGGIGNRGLPGASRFGLQQSPNLGRQPINNPTNNNGDD